MWDSTVLIGAGALVVSGLLTGAARRLALSQGVLDIPNERSSHRQATPRGGGVSVVLVNTAAAGMLLLLGIIPPYFLAALCGGIAVAAIGFMDDRGAVSPAIRLAVHVLAAIWAILWLGGLPPLPVSGYSLELGWLGYLLGVLAIAWTLNLYNFMDGIDGIAASEAVFIAVAGAALTLYAGGLQVPAAAIVFGSACAGFLLWNWPPAKIFMGDVGSGYLGYVIAVLALASSHENPVLLWVWLILGGVFFVDATVTLIRRTLRGDRVYEAHRSHAYQWLARRWGSHKRVTLTVLALNLLWLLPCACFALTNPELAVWTLVVALAPLVIAALATGAGRPEDG